MAVHEDGSEETVDEKNKLGIKDLSEADRPREKMLEHGAQALSDAELLAILIGSGNDRESAIQLSQRILLAAGGTLCGLSKFRQCDLVGVFRGVGPVKAITIRAAMELGRRMRIADPDEKPIINSSEKAFEYLAPMLLDKQTEEMWILLLNNALKPLKRVCIAKGGVSETTVDIRLIIKEASEHLASAVIMAHNHPSGQLIPSKQDIQITKRVSEVLRMINVRLNDHLIVGERAYYSFADSGDLF